MTDLIRSQRKAIQYYINLKEQATTFKEIQEYSDIIFDMQKELSKMLTDKK